MMKCFLLIAVAAGLLWLPSSQTCVDDNAPEISAKDSFAKIKSLAGDWYDDSDAAVLVSQVRVVAGGSAVMETLFPGTDKEMISLYHLDGDQLLMSHYCMLGNQPHFRAVSSDGEIRFEFVRGTNMDPEVDMHIHAGLIKFIDDDRVQTRWTPYENGQALDSYEFELTRLQEPPTSDDSKTSAVMPKKGSCCGPVAR